MGGGGSPAPPPPPPAPVAAPTAADVSVVEAGQRVQNAAKSGVGSTVATSGAGLTDEATTSRKSLLGQ